MLVVGGQVLGQVFLLGSMPVLTRAFPPEVFGTYQLGLALALIFQPLASLRVEFIIPVTGPEEHARELYRLAAGCTTVISLGVVLIAELTPIWSDATRTTLIVFALMLAVNALSAIDNATLIRRNLRARLAARNLLYGIVAAPLQVAVALIEPQVWLLAVVLLIARGVAIAATTTWSRAVLTTDTLDREPYGWSRAGTTTVAGVISNSSVHGLTVLSGALLSTSAAAQVGTAQRVTSSPIALSGQALSQVFQSQVAAIQRSGRPGLERASRRFVTALAIAASPLAALMAVLGPLLAQPILGAEWQDAGYVIAILAVPTCLQLVIAPTIPILVMQRREQLLLRLQVVRLALGVFAGGVPALVTASYMWTAAGYAAATTLAYIATIGVTLRVCRQYDERATQVDATIGTPYQQGNCRSSPRGTGRRRRSRS